MNNSDNSGCALFLMFLVYVVAWVGSGVAAWNWVEPESFGGALVFLIAWAFFGYIFQMLGGIVIAIISESID